MRRRSARGFTYLGLIILVTIIGLVGAAGMKMGSLLQRAAAEEELLEIGAQFSQALRSYAVATPQGQLQQPPSLQALLKDTRFPNPRRHLRKIFVDPVTGKAEWGIMYFGDNAGVIGVYSLSTRRPLKIANFDSRFVNMDNRDRISDWKFLRAGDDAVNPAQLTPGRGTMPASLFRPGALPNEGRSRDGQPLGHMPIAPPPEPAPVRETPVEEAKPDEGQPMGAPVEEAKEEAKEEEKEKEKEKEKDADEQQAQDDASGTSAEVK